MQKGAPMKSRKEPSIESIAMLSGVDTLPPGRLEIATRMAELSQMSAGKKVLAVSSNRGYQSVIYAKEFQAEVIGIDIDETVVTLSKEYAEKSGIKVTFITADAQSLPFEEDTFDIVTNEGAVGIPDHPQTVLDEMIRVLKPGGTFVFRESIFCDDMSPDEQAELQERYGNETQTVAGWKQMIEKAGAKLESVEKSPWSEPSMFWNVRHDRVVENYHDIYTMMEKLSTSKKVMKLYGKEGLSNASDNEEIFYQAVLDRKIGYGIFLGKKV